MSYKAVERKVLPAFGTCLHISNYQHISAFSPNLVIQGK